MEEFIAFKAAIALIHEAGLDSIIDDVYSNCKRMENAPLEECSVNYVKAIYAPFTDEQISNKISQLVSDEESVPVQCIFQTIEGLHQACPNHKGDWYFSGDYPTKGGLRMLYRTFVYYYEHR